jgi:D-alanyl-D-alanine carboxypeptidase
MMFRPRRSALVIGLAIALGSVIGAPQASAFTSGQEAAMHCYADAVRTTSGFPGLTVGVWREGSGHFVYSTGASVLGPNGGTRRPMRPSQRTRIGSITKTFTATVVLQLVEAGRVRLGDPVNDYIRGLPHGRKISIRELLNHTSGLRDFPRGPSRSTLTQPERKWSVTRLIRRGFDMQLLFAPGSSWSYSNIGYLTLGRVAEKVTGRPLAKLYERRITGPLRLSATGAAANARMPTGAVHGYFRKRLAEAPLDTIDWNYSWAFGAGSMYSTLADLRRYAPHLATGRGLLSKRTQRKRLQFVPVPDSGGNAYYGLGIFKEILYGEPFLGHNGEVYGYNSWVGYSKPTKTTIVVVGNTAPDLLRPPQPDADAMAALLVRAIETSSCT